MKDKITEFFKENKVLIIILFVCILIIIITNVLICFLESSCYIEYSDDTDDITYDSIEREEEIDNILEVEDFEIEFFDEPEPIEKRFYFFASGNPVQVTSKNGEVISGTILSSGKSLVGYDYYLLKSDSIGKYPYDRIIYSESESLGYVLYTVPGPYTLLDDRVFEDFYPEKELFQHLIGVKDAFVPDILKEDNEEFKSDNGNRYLYRENFVFINGFVEIVDQVGDVNIYYRGTNDLGSHYIRNNDGTYSSLNLVPPFVEMEKGEGISLNLSLSFVTNTGETVTNIYDYGSRYCFDDEGLDFSRAPLSMFEKIGKFSNGDSVYQKKDRKDASLQFYYDVYVENGHSKDAPEYEVYEKSYPIIYWQDPFGRFMALYNADYRWIGGCRGF